MPELLEGGDGTDLYIQKGTVKLPALTKTIIRRQGKESWFGGTNEEAYLFWQGVVKILAKDACALIVEPVDTQIDPKFLSLYILSEALGIILFQKGLLLIHASAIKIGSQTIVFFGNAGIGKSTTAAAFAKRGHTVLTDDMVAIKVDESNGIKVIPGFPQIKIWPPSVEGLGYNGEALTPLFSGSRKRVIQQRENFPKESIPLSQLFFLNRGEQLKITPMNQVETMLLLRAYFPCPYKLLQGTSQKEHFRQCTQLLNQIKVSKIERPDDFAILNQLITQIETELMTVDIVS